MNYSFVLFKTVTFYSQKIKILCVKVLFKMIWTSLITKNSSYIPRMRKNFVRTWETSGKIERPPRGEVPLSHDYLGRPTLHFHRRLGWRTSRTSPFPYNRRRMRCESHAIRIFHGPAISPVRRVASDKNKWRASVRVEGILRRAWIRTRISMDVGKGVKCWRKWFAESKRVLKFIVFCLFLCL